MDIAATLNDHRVTRARVSVPKWGCWFADVDVDGEVDLTGRVTLTMSDLVLRGAVLSGGKSLGRSHYKIVAGAGGWGKLLPAKGYQNDAGVKLAKVIGNAAEECGETIATIDPALTVGPAFTRTNDEPASRVLELTVPKAWYVDEEGVLQLGARKPGTLPKDITRIAPVDQNRRRLTIASTSIRAILPGITIDGLDVVDVEHEISEEGLRSTLWGSLAGGSSRAASALMALLEQLDPDRTYRGTSEFRIVTQNNNRLNLQPIRVSSGMPNLSNVHVRPGVAGTKHSYRLGSRVVVGFIDADPSRPIVVAEEEADGQGYVPVSTKIEASAEVDVFAPIVNVGDETARALAHAQEVGLDFTALLTQVAAQATFAAALKVIVDSLAPASGVTAGQKTTFDTAEGTFVTACTTVGTAIGVQASTLPTTKAMGT